ncbi:MAG: hypothetical protein H6R26_1157, partial [Proteobacteria bacterium]|nr:hypothetical protein [Pseudomonadota bacterium]
ILINLVSNAIKFTPRGEIVVRVDGGCERCADKLCADFSVRDTGIGIPAEKQKLIFDAFAQADASSTRMFGGTGLGLSISSRLVSLMGGRIWLESEPGQGSTFHFTVPFGVPEEASPAPKYRALDLRGVKVLIVDDHPVNRRIFMEMLPQWGMDPYQAGSGEDALDAIIRADADGAPFRLILLDAMMPVMDGFTVAARIREARISAPPTIMLLSSADRAGDIEKSREFGIRQFLRKPVKYSELQDAIQEALGGSAADLADGGTGATASIRSAQKALRILAAEDNPVNQRLVQALLEDRGHEVIMVANGEEALRAVEDKDFDVILMDVQMPVMDGLQATALLRKREAEQGRHAYVVAMTAHALKGDRERCLAAGMDAYVPKPIRETELLAAVERWYESSNPLNEGTAFAMAETPAFDLPAALARVRGRRGLLKDLAGLVVAQMDGLLRDCDQAVANQDAASLERAAHTLKSSAASLCAAATADLAQNLENAGRHGDLESASSLIPQLRSSAERLVAALVTFLDEPDPPRE